MHTTIMGLGAVLYALVGLNGLLSSMGYPMIDVPNAVTVGAYFGTAGFFILNLFEAEQ